MGIFGSREDDPLLQNDPLAPASEDDDAAPEKESSDEHSPAEDDSEGTGVFSRSTSSSADEGDPSAENAPDTRTLTHSLTETINGRLSDLNDALDRGWRLTRVEVRQKDALDGDPSDFSPSLDFILRRPAPE